MPFRNPFRRSQDDRLECKRQYKTDATRVNIAGIDYNGIKLGQLGVEPLLQTVSQTLLLLDFSQYQLCLSIRGMRDTEQKQEYIKKMTDQQLEAQKIYQALYALSVNPRSKELLDILKEMFFRTLPTIDSIRENSQEVDTTSLKEKIQGIDTKVKFYDTVIKKLDRMLNNPGL